MGSLLKKLLSLFHGVESTKKDCSSAEPFSSYNEPVQIESNDEKKTDDGSTAEKFQDDAVETDCSNSSSLTSSQLDEIDAAPSDNDNSEEEEFVPYRNVHAAPSDDPSELDQYDYELPERLIAQTPLPDRTAARMMVVDRATQTISHMHVRDIVKFLRPNDALVLNDTKVVPARLMGKREKTEGRWEGLFLQYDPKGLWEIMSKTRGKLQPGERIALQNPEGAYKRFLEVVARTEAKTLIVKPLLEEGEDSFTFLDKVGWTPIPPYIRSGRMKPSDRLDYQTVYARIPGAVAAPTAGLHFTKELLVEIQKQGVAICPITLHVGAGTFKPISVTKLSDHHMHSEYATITDKVVQTLKERKSRGGRVFAVGTTSVRTLESASNVLDDGTIDSSGQNDKELQAFSGATNLFIRPPYKFKTVDAMLTNFHLPKSTLIILVRTFGGDELLKRAYEEAIAEDYRFYSYGDAMLIL